MTAPYRGKAKCACGTRAKWTHRDLTRSYFACPAHVDRLPAEPDAERPHPVSEADRQSWLRLAHGVLP